MFCEVDMKLTTHVPRVCKAGCLGGFTYWKASSDAIRLLRFSVEQSAISAYARSTMNSWRIGK